VQFGVGSRPGSCTGFGRSVGRFGLVSGLGSGRFWAEVVLVHLFGFFAVSGFFGGRCFWFCFAGLCLTASCTPVPAKSKRGNINMRMLPSTLARYIDGNVGNRLWFGVLVFGLCASCVRAEWTAAQVAKSA